MITPAALREIRQLQGEADRLLKLPNLSRSDAKKADLLIAKIAAIRQAGYSSDEQRQMVANQISGELGLPQVDYSAETPEQRAHQALFRNFLAGVPDNQLEQEARTNTAFKVGTQAHVFSAGPAGGVLVPVKFAQQVAEARAAIDPLFDSRVVTLVQEESFTLPPLTIPAWDLSEVAATKVSESDQHAPDVIPNIDGKLTNRYTYRATLSGSFEFETDSKAYGSAEAALARAFGVAFGRGVSSDLVVGDGVTGPQGVLTGAVDSGITTANAGKLVLTDFTNVFYSLNAAYRNSPKCAWLMADSTHKMAAEAVDDAGRPLFPVVGGVMYIMGRPCYISPSLPTGAGSKGIVFGDLSAMYVHSSTLYIRRRTQYPGLVEYGKCAWTGLQMVDACVVDPTDGANSGAYSPIKYATLHV